MSWKRGANDIIGTKTASGAVTIFPAFQGHFSISPNDPATLVIHNTTAAEGKEITCTVITDLRSWNDVISVVIKGECSFCCFTKCICMPYSSIFRIILLTPQGNLHWLLLIVYKQVQLQCICGVRKKIKLNV